MADQTYEQRALDLLIQALPQLKLAKAEAMIAGDKKRKARLVAALAQVNLAVANLMTKGEVLEDQGPMFRVGGSMTVGGSVVGGDSIETHTTVIHQEPE